VAINIQYLSHSAINQFISCPRMWASKYIQGIVEAGGDAAMFGTHFEKLTCEDMGFQVTDEQRNKLPIGEYRKRYGNQELNTAVAHYQKQKFAWKTADEAQKFIEITPARWTELAGQYNADPHLALRLIGYIDLYRKTPESASLADEIRPTEVLDLKTISTDSWKPDWARQVVLYALATGASRCVIHRFVRGSLDKLACKTIELATPEARELVKQVMDTIAYYVRQIKQIIDDPAMADHLPRAPGYHCTYCPLSEKCASGGTFNGVIPSRIQWAKKETVTARPAGHAADSVDDLLGQMGAQA
jgi:hypothetical protein